MFFLRKWHLFLALNLFRLAKKISKENRKTKVMKNLCLICSIMLRKSRLKQKKKSFLIKKPVHK